MKLALVVVGTFIISMQLSGMNGDQSGMNGGKKSLSAPPTPAPVAAPSLQLPVDSVNQSSTPFGLSSSSMSPGLFSVADRLSLSPGDPLEKLLQDLLKEQKKTNGLLSQLVVFFKSQSKST